MSFRWIGWVACLVLPPVSVACDLCGGGGGLGFLAAQDGEEASPETRPRMRRFGRLPEWVQQSWYMRRQVEAPWVLKGVHVVDVGTGDIQRDVNILIQGDRIGAVGPLEPFGSIKIVDASGHYVIPGLFDLHAHVMPKSMFFPDAEEPEVALRMLLNAGVTTIRALPLYSESALGWAARINQGELVGPTIVPTSSILEKEAQRTSRGFGDAETAVSWIRKEALMGARWVKVYNSMDEESFRAIVETAREYGMKVCGHANEVPPHRAAALGMGTIEHAISLSYSALRDGAGEPPGDGGIRQAAWYWKHADPDKLQELMKTFLRHGTGWVPTFVVQESMVSSRGHDGHSMDDKTLSSLREAMGTAAKLAVGLHRAGGLVGIGTDFPVDGVRPGESVHRELEILVEVGGATPLEALQMGTVSSARILGFQDLLGRVEEGRLAHFVVLKLNPLESIGNIRSIRYVVHDGRLVEVGVEGE